MDVTENLSRPKEEKAEEDDHTNSDTHLPVKQNLIKQEHDIVISSYGSIVCHSKATGGSNATIITVTDGYIKENIEIDEPGNIKIESSEVNCIDHIKKEKPVNIKAEPMNKCSEGLKKEDTEDMNAQVTEHSGTGMLHYGLTKCEFSGEGCHVDSLKTETSPSVISMASEGSNKKNAASSDKAFKCNDCGKSFARKRDLKQHELLHTGEKPHSCEICGKSFNRKSSLRQHNLLHTGEKPHSCTVCGKSFTGKSDLNNHSLLHTGEKPHACTVCGKSFALKKYLTNHHLMHTGEKQHSCSVCGKLLSSKGNLTQHQLLHTGEKPHSCTVCGKSYTYNSRLKQHQLSHTGEKHYSCTVCGKSFARKDNLTRHKGLHSGERPHSCAVCGKSFTQKIHLINHQLLHSGERTHS